MKIALLQHNEIDFDAYNRCIESSPFATMYAMSWYLDAVSLKWNLLMADDYRYVMPLPVKQKWGLKYLTQPYFCQQLGIFSSYPLTADVYKNFISAIPYCICRLQFNSGNFFDDSLSVKNNYTLKLNDLYLHIRENYKKNFIRNIRKAEKENLRLEKSTDWQIFLDVVKNNAGKSPILHLLSTFETIVRQIKNRVIIEIWSVKNEGEIILSSALFIRWKNRIYYMLPVSTAEGKAKQSMSFLLDKFIETYAGQPFILDFEGSSLPNIARFYANVGGVKESFPVLFKPRILFDLLAFAKKFK
jgi:hypothetical protein